MTELEHDPDGGCNDCPLFNTLEKACEVAGRAVSFDHRRDGPAPDWCKLRQVDPGEVAVVVRRKGEM